LTVAAVLTIYAKIAAAFADQPIEVWPETRVPAWVLGAAAGSDSARVPAWALPPIRKRKAFWG